MSRECLDCALGECDTCAMNDEYGGGYYAGGCCCGHIRGDACNHDWLNRPESDTYVCEMCGAER